MQLKPEQERVSTLLKETITLMCKNGLKFETKFTIDAVIGVTLDEKEVFLISVNEIFNAEQSEREVNTDDSSGSDTGSIVHRRKRRRKRAIKKESHGDGELAEDQAEEDKPCVQLESTDHDSNDDSSILFIKEEPQSSWQVLAGTYQDTGDQSKSEAMVSYPSDNVMPDGAAVNFANVSYQSANNNSSMTWSSPGQSGASYISSSGDQLGMPHLAGHAQQGQNQISQFRISSASAAVRGQCTGKQPASTSRLSWLLGGQQEGYKGVPLKGKRDRCCGLCGKRFTSQYGYQVHLKRHQGIHPYTCEVCGKGMSSKTNYDEHMRHHTGKLLHCGNCSRSFITHRSYRSHMLSCK